MEQQQESCRSGPDGSGMWALIPAWNEAASVGGVVAAVRPWVDAVLVVDDGSADATAARAEAAGARVIRHAVNRGKGAALWSGLQDAFVSARPGPGWIVVVDADGQHDPGDIPRLVDAARRTGARIVVGTRMDEPAGMPWIRYLTNRYTSWRVSRLAGQPIPDSQCGYRLIHRSLMAAWQPQTQNFDTESEMLIVAARAGLRLASAPVRTIYVESGRRSRIHPVRDTIRFFAMLRRLRRTTTARR